MSLRIEDYALLGDMHTAALAGSNGSIDWFCVPRFDGPPCFAALLGGPDNGYWKIAPIDRVRSTSRCYRGDSLVLETTFACDGGTVSLAETMPLDRGPRIVRSVTGIDGSVRMRMDYVVRFDYGSIVPWVRRTSAGLLAIAGPDALLLAADVETDHEGLRTFAEFTVTAGDAVDFELSYFASELRPRFGGRKPAKDVLGETQRCWEAWSRRCKYGGPYRDVVMRSLITLRALMYRPTGGIVAAPTTSLPEKLGGVRNWDYRYCWLRDATFTLYSLLGAGYTGSARQWRDWLLRAVAGDPDDLQIVYSVRGGRRIPEMELPWLAGYEASKPVRIGNGAHGQFQLDVYGEVVDLLRAAHRAGMAHDPDEWPLSRKIVEDVAQRWMEPDRGLWEVRGDPQHFVHSKVMAWVALDRAVAAVEEDGCEGSAERWREIRDRIHADVCERGFDAQRNTFTQYYGSQALDASTLLIPSVGFLPPEDPRVAGTVAAIERDLMRDGLVLRYTQPDAEGPDPLPPGEGAFLACSFWLADAYALIGREADARALFERLVALTNDVGLLAEEYDPQDRRQVGNFPQAFSHVGLINSAFNLSGHHHIRPAKHRAAAKAAKG